MGRHKKKKLIPIKCEVCGEDNKSVLHKHHIIGRKEVNTSNDDMNLAVLCANCHNKTHSGLIKIIGIYPSTQSPYNRTLVYEVDGKKNVEGIDEPYFKPKADSMKVFYNE